MSTFTPLSADPAYVSSREIRPGPPARSISGYHTIEVRCGSCTHQWTSRPGDTADGGFKMALGSVRVGCPAYGAEGAMNGAEVAALARG